MPLNSLRRLIKLYEQHFLVVKTAFELNYKEHKVQELAKNTSNLSKKAPNIIESRQLPCSSFHSFTQINKARPSELIATCYFKKVNVPGRKTRLMQKRIGLCLIACNLHSSLIGFLK